jgi:aminoglycoside phosphotransferase (APT) family kinase protein
MTTELAEIERRLAERFPELAVAPLRELEIGFGSVVVETAGGVVFRIARHARAAAGHACEETVLPGLRDRLPLAVPDPRWRIEPGTPGFPHGAIGYRRLPGASLSPASLTRLDAAAIADELAAFLLALHRFPVHAAEALGLPHRDRDAGALAALRDDVLPPLADALTPEEHRVVSAWWDRLLADPLVLSFTPAVRHGDLWYDHLLVDTSGRVTGVLDWEAVAIGDPARDFAVQLHLGAAFADAVLASYAAQGGMVDAALKHRVARQWELREFGGVRGAAELDDGEELEDAVRKLRAGPILAG